MSDPSGFVWEALLAARSRTGRGLTMEQRAGFGWPAIPEFCIREEFPADEFRSPLTVIGWRTMSGCLVALRKL